MMRIARSFPLANGLLLFLIPEIAFAKSDASKEHNFSQEMLEIPVRVVDPDGEPVAEAKIVPWALRCSQGHGPWSTKGFAASQPPQLLTDEDGRAKVPYPRYTKLAEGVQTTQVTLSVDHPDYAYVMYEFINVPREETGLHEIKLQRGAAVELVPVLHGQPMPLDNLFAVWADGRNWSESSSSVQQVDNALHIPPMPAGTRQVLLVKLKGDRATHFSPILDLQLQEGVTHRESVEMQPAVTVRGKLSEKVPRPVKNGRLKAWALSKVRESDQRSNIDWITWVPVAEDGTFTIDAWPAGEAVQLIALCEGHIAASGPAPDEVENPRDPETDPFQRPQVFRPEELAEGITILMEPLVTCEFQTVDGSGNPIAEVKVQSCPNVGWWNSGSQVYCSPLVRCERMLQVRDYRKVIDEAFPYPFETTTDTQGRGTLLLPAGEKDLYVEHEKYELPINRGRREIEVQLVAGETSKVSLKLQPKGTEYLGEWDKLAGVLFGCTGEECRRLLEDEGFRRRMESVRKRYDKSSDPQDPDMLSEVFDEIADAFAELDDEEAEVQRWRKKAAEQKQKLKDAASEKAQE